MEKLVHETLMLLVECTMRRIPSGDAAHRPLGAALAQLSKVAPDEELEDQPEHADDCDCDSCELFDLIFGEDDGQNDQPNDTNADPELDEKKEDEGAEPAGDATTSAPVPATTGAGDEPAEHEPVLEQDHTEPAQASDQTIIIPDDTDIHESDAGIHTYEKDYRK